MKTLLTLIALTTLTSSFAEAREYECFGLDEAPDSNPRLRFQITIDYQSIGHWAGNEVFLKEEDGTTYLLLRKGDEQTVAISKTPHISMLFKKGTSWKDITHALFCDDSQKGPGEK